MQAAHSTTTTFDCLPHEEHGHAHGDGCGHASIQHGEHLDWVHNGHRHAEHDGHWDEHPQAAAFASGLGWRAGAG